MSKAPTAVGHVDVGELGTVVTRFLSPLSIGVTWTRPVGLVGLLTFYFFRPFYGSNFLESLYCHPPFPHIVTVSFGNTS